MSNYDPYKRSGAKLFGLTRDKTEDLGIRLEEETVQTHLGELLKTEYDIINEILPWNEWKQYDKASKAFYAGVEINKKHVTKLQVNNYYIMLPNNIGQLKQLKLIELKNTRLKNLPESISQIIGLEFNLEGYSGLVEIPKWLKEAKENDVAEKMQALKIKKYFKL